MREFPNAAARPWRFVVTPKTDSTEVWVDLVANGGIVIGEPYYHGQAEYNDDPEANAALIVHAVNTYEERERLLEEAAYIFRSFIERESEAWKPVRVFRTEEEAEADEVRHGVWTEVADDARAFLAKLEARDA